MNVLPEMQNYSISEGNETDICFLLLGETEVDVLVDLFIEGTANGNLH